MSRNLVAAIDLGTNTALCLIACRRADGELEVIEDHCRTPRLGGGLGPDGALDDSACERALQALEFFADRLAVLGVAPERTRAVGTAVLRRARHADAFVARVRERTGIVLEVISGTEEARLGELAVRAEGVSPEAVIVDVGGGSSEVSCAALGWRVSLPLGAVVLTDAWLAAGERSEVDPEILEWVPDLERERDVVVLGGTGVNLACLVLGLPRFDHALAEGAQFAENRVREFAERLHQSTPAERLALPIEPERAAILPAGLSLLAAILERLGAKKVRVTGRGLRFGVARELLAASRGRKSPPAAPGSARDPV